MEKQVVKVEGQEIEITHPERVIWPEAGIAKLDYLRYLMQIAPYLLPYTRDRMLMVWRYPEGIQGRRVEERSIHGHAPDWVPRAVYLNKERILLNDAATLVWVANRGGIELHVPFDRHDRKDYPTELVFDLDPAEGMSFTASNAAVVQGMTGVRQTPNSPSPKRDELSRESRPAARARKVRCKQGLSFF